MNRIGKFALVAGLALGLAGCAGLGQFTNPVSTTQVYDLENAYGVLQAQANAYASLPFCPRGTTIQQSVTRLCSLAEAVVRLQQADVVARKALADAEAFVRANPQLSPASALAAARAAIETVAAIERQFAVGGTR